MHSCRYRRHIYDFETLAFMPFYPSLVLDGPTPRLIDEWQTAPEIWESHPASHR
jgi:hypothetical protein